ncbi:MAG: hypothetical protein RIC03_00165 [Cyclobacteriaceae bacterium]
MNYVDWIGAIGVFQILLAYFLNTIGTIDKDDLRYLGLNLLGAMMACTASILLDYLPFVVLEGVWAVVSLVAFIRKLF